MHIFYNIYAMNGWLIVNRFLYTDKFSDIYDRLLKAAAKAGSALKLVTNADFLMRTDTQKIVLPDLTHDRPDYIIFWDKDIRLARTLEANGIRLFNCADAIEACDDKSLTTAKLADIVNMPATFNVPFTYEHLGYSDTGFLDNIESQLGYPFILKECFGSFGAQVHLVRSRKQCEDILASVNGRPCIIQEYIATPDGTGKDIRINVVGDTCVASMLRYNENDFRANITAGGRMEPYTPSEDEKDMALRVCRALKLDYAGVDILFGKNGEPMLCEVNSNAHFKSIYDCTGINVADAIMEHILKTITR